MRILSQDEEERLLKCCSLTLKPIIITALHTGFRTSELLSLTWDVDLRHRTITVRAAYAKNEESRSVPMNNLLTTTLKTVRLSASGDGPVFRTPQETPCRNFRTAFERAVRKANIDGFTFHDLRHTFASRLVMAGVDLPTVQALMGHKTIAMTLRYTHLSSGHKQRAVAALEQFQEKSPVNFHDKAHNLSRRSLVNS